MIPRAGACRQFRPCEGVPTISSAGTTAYSVTPACGEPGTSGIISTTVTLSGSLPAGAKCQYRDYFGTNSSPGDGDYTSWADLFTSGASGTRNNSIGEYSTTDNGQASDTYYYNVQWRVLGIDGTTVCDGDGPHPSQFSDVLWNCTV